LAQRLDQLIGPNGAPGYDVLHVEHLRGARYGLHSLANRGLGTSASLPVIWDSVDCISLLFRQAAIHSQRMTNRWITRFELPRTEHYERGLISQFDKVLVTSAADQKAFNDLRSENERKRALSIEVIPNGVDLDYFSVDTSVQREPATLVISGKMSYHANVSMVLHFVNDVMPLVWNQNPEVKLCVVGKDPPIQIRSLAQNPKIQVTGTVKDLRPYLRSASLAVAPLTYGVGIQNKVLEAMACGTPVISTSQAVSALQAVPGRDVIVGNGAEELARNIIFYLNNPELRQKIGLAGRKYVENHHRWGLIVDHLLEVYHEAIEVKRSVFEKASV
jgi:glycosyltransferase involved in cell wall biosynthesis